MSAIALHNQRPSMHPQVFPNELEAQREFEGFTEWLQTFELYRGKQGRIV